MTPRRKKAPRKFAGFFLVFVVGVTYLLATSGFFRRNAKPTFIINNQDGVVVSVFDRQLGTITDVTIPGNTQVNVSRQLGTWKLASVWKLGENEKLGGVLLAETIVRNFKIPVSAWRDDLSGKTNLGVGDRFFLWIFSLKVSSGGRKSVDLVGQNFLKKTRLVSGEEGYLISGSLPPSLYYLFSDTKINKANPRIVIEDATGGKTAVDTVVTVLEVLGAKPAAIIRKDKSDLHCEVVGKDKETVIKIGSLFDCLSSFKENEDNFDVTVKIGSAFAKRF